MSTYFTCNNQGELWYRFDSCDVCAGIDESGEVIHTDEPIVDVYLKRYSVIKHTPKGVWLDNGRFVLKDARKRYACPTVEEARDSFKARKTAQIRILRRRARSAELAMGLIDFRFPPEAAA
jgi:hypothetical protein